MYKVLWLLLADSGIGNKDDEGVAGTRNWSIITLTFIVATFLMLL